MLALQYKVLLIMLFNKQYFFFAVTLFIIEVFIATFVHDAFVRPYLGDLFVVILLYCSIRSFLQVNTLKTAFAVLIISYLIEISQFFNLTRLAGWENSKIASLMLGSSFSFIDILMYTLGILIVIIIEIKIKHEKSVR